MAQMARPHPATLSNYIQRIKDLMHMKDWTVTVSDDVGGMDDDTLAFVDVRGWGRTAIITFNPGLWGYPPEEIRRVVVHELAHIIVNDMKLGAESLRESLGVLGWSAFWERFDNDMEVAVEWMTRIVAPMLPMPGWSR